MMLAAFILLDIPIFLFLAWLAFDDKSIADDTLRDATFAILKGLFCVGKSTADDWDEPDEFGNRGPRFDLMPNLCFYFACAAIVFGEYHLIHKFS